MIRFSVRGLLRHWRHGHGPAYLHIPKTGGTYLGQRETDGHPVLTPMRYLGHLCVVADKASSIYPPTVGFQPNYLIEHGELRNNTLFSTVRNPWDWLVSYYFHAGGIDPRYANPRHYDYFIARKGFEYLLDTIANRDRNTWPNRQLIHFQLFRDDGALIVDWINNTNTLDDDICAFAEHFGARYQCKQIQRRSRDDDYRSYYNDRTASLVEEVWGREIRLFGFDFDRVVCPNAPLRREVTDAQKRRIHYHWDDDRLLVDGGLW